MSLDGNAEMDAMKSRLASLCGGRVYDPLPDDFKLPRDATSGLVLPYIILDFGTMFPTQLDRSIEGADQQPQILPWTVECWASDPDSPKRTAGAVRTLYVGWSPNDNASEIELGGGRWFAPRVNTGRPGMFMQLVSGTILINNSITVP